LIAYVATAIIFLISHISTAVILFVSYTLVVFIIWLGILSFFLIHWALRVASVPVLMVLIPVILLSLAVFLTYWLYVGITTVQTDDLVIDMGAFLFFAPILTKIILDNFYKWVESLCEMIRKITKNLKKLLSTPRNKNNRRN